MRLAVGITLAVLFGAAVLTYFLLGSQPSDSAAGVVATSLPSPVSPTSEYWTEERMRAAKPVDMTVGPDGYELALGIGGLIAVAGVIVVLIRRKR